MVNARSQSYMVAIFALASAAILLLFTSLAVHGWDKISFLDVGTGAEQVRYGIFGRAGTRPRIGYEFLPPGSSVAKSVVLQDSVTKALILHPIAGVLSAISATLGLFNHHTTRIYMALLTAVAALTTATVWCIDMILFGSVAARYREQNIPARYGNANWLTLGAFVAQVLGFNFAIRMVYAKYRRGRR